MCVCDAYLFFHVCFISQNRKKKKKKKQRHTGHTHKIEKGFPKLISFWQSEDAYYTAMEACKGGELFVYVSNIWETQHSDWISQQSQKPQRPAINSIHPWHLLCFLFVFVCLFIFVNFTLYFCLCLSLYFHCVAFVFV